MAEGFYDFTPGQVLTAAQVDDYLMRQAIMRFADSAARTTALSGVLIEGMMSYLKDTNTVEVYDGTAWVGVGGVSNANFTDTETGTFTEGGIDYKYLIFTSSGTVTFDTDGLADFLVVAGGGGSNTFQTSSEPASAGGGAGGCLEALGYYITAGTYTVTVGAGGAGINRWARNANGSDSSIGTVLQSLGGGGGGYGTTVNDAVSGHQSRAAGGGSGGGCGYGWFIDTNSKGGEAVPGQGNRGGDYYYGGSSNVGGGGGGWGAQGGPTGTNQPCDGGIGGISTIVTAAIATANSIGEVSGSDVYYGGGGAGNAKIATYDGTGGLGGGGDIGNAGTANTGGGGGAGTAVVPSVGYNGGSGVVIIRVAV
jgi:hypothetical protein